MVEKLFKKIHEGWSKLSETNLLQETTVKQEENVLFNVTLNTFYLRCQTYDKGPHR